MEEIINIIADLHNFESLKYVLEKFDNLFCLGDIGATIEVEEFFKNENFKRYNLCFKAFKNNDFSKISEDDKEWFRSKNIEGWKKQLDTIRNSDKSFILARGNADLAMLNFFQECRKYLNKTLKSSKMEFVEEPKIKVINNIQILFLPFKETPYNLGTLRSKINPKKSLLILSHCPAFEKSKKKYYMHVYDALKTISNVYKEEIIFIHGHIHPSLSYEYKRRGLENIRMLALKAKEGFDGISTEHDIFILNTRNLKFSIVDSKKNEEVSLIPLPEEFEINEGHWNDFEEKIK